MLSPRADDEDDDEQDEDYNDYDNEEEEKEQIISMLKPIHTLTNQSINQLTHTHIHTHIAIAQSNQ